MENRNQLHTIYIALGSNLGERLVNLQSAADALPPTIRIRERSPVYETSPWGYLEQPLFLNQVVKAETALPPPDLLSYLKNVENQMGREMTHKYGPRSIDLDIIFYGDLILDTPKLTIPHPHLANRAFVLLPLADLDPDLRHPISNLTVGEMLVDVEVEGIRLYVPKNFRI